MECKDVCIFCNTQLEVYDISYYPPMYGTRCPNGCGEENRMNDILIKKTPNADTRSMDEGTNLNKRLIFLDTEEHIEAVQSTMKEVANVIVAQSLVHDSTKIADFDNFFDALNEHVKDSEKNPIKKSAWYQMHISEERHHLSDSVPSDVNLIDILEMIVDGVVAGKARTGDVYPVEISNDILQKAVKNTQKLIIKHVKVEG